MDAISNNETVAQFARALFDLAREKNETTKTLEAAERLAQVYRDSGDFRLFVSHPRFDQESMKRVLDALDKKLHFGDILRNTLNLLAQTRNLELFPDVCSLLRAQVAEERGEIKAHVVSASTLSVSEKRTVEEALLTRISNTPAPNANNDSSKGVTKEAEKRSLSLSFSEDSALLSGLVITMGSRMIDLSLRSDLRRLRKALSVEKQAA